MFRGISEEEKRKIVTKHRAAREQEYTRKRDGKTVDMGHGPEKQLKKMLNQMKSDSEGREQKLYEEDKFSKVDEQFELNYKMDRTRISEDKKHAPETAPHKERHFAFRNKANIDMLIEEPGSHN